MKYSEKLKDPRWQKKRLEIFERDEFTCQGCLDTETTLAVHHRRYLSGKDPWDYPDHLLVTLCENCHEQERTERPSAEQLLLNTLREKPFLYHHLVDIAHGFSKLEMVHTPDILTTSLDHFLSSPSALRAAVDTYLQGLINRKGKDGPDSLSKT